DAGARLDRRVGREGGRPAPAPRAARRVLAIRSRKGAVRSLRRRGRPSPGSLVSSRPKSRRGRRGGDAIRMRRRLVAGLLASLTAAFASGWTYPEHRAITAAGIATLDPRDRTALDALWASARSGEPRLCEQDYAGDQGARPACIDLAAWPAIA